MALPVCPSCKSKNVVPSLAKNSHNNCVGCGYTGFVREFHPEELEHHKPGDRVQTNGHFVGEPAEEPRKPRYWWQKD